MLRREGRPENNAAPPATMLARALARLPRAIASAASPAASAAVRLPLVRVCSVLGEAGLVSGSLGRVLRHGEALLTLTTLLSGSRGVELGECPSWRGAEPGA